MAHSDTQHASEQACTVLIVDDEPSCRSVLARMLEVLGGFQVIPAADAIEAQKILTENSFSVDVCLVDLCLPVVPGEELLSWIKQNAPDLPVVMTSGSRTDERLVHCLKNGAVDFIEKPAKSKALAKVLRHAIKRQMQMEERLGEIQVDNHASDWVELTAPSEMEYLGRIQRFTEMILQERLPKNICEDLRLAFEEVGRNAIEWGNKFDREKQFCISYCFFDDRIVFKFEDEGEGFKPDTLGDPTKDPKAHVAKRKEDGKRPGGFGVYLVQKLMDEVAYSERGNVVLMTKYF